MPYGITKVATADGRLLYQHPAESARVLVAPLGGGRQMTDLLQTAVNTGTGARRPDRPPGGGQDGHDLVQQGRLVPRLLLAG